MTYLRVVAGCFKGCFMGGSIRVIEDILLSERDGNARPSNNGPCFLYVMNWEREGSRDSIQESTSFNKIIKKSGPLTMGDKGQVLV